MSCCFSGDSKRTLCEHVLDEITRNDSHSTQPNGPRLSFNVHHQVTFFIFLWLLDSCSQDWGVGRETERERVSKRD